MNKIFIKQWKNRNRKKLLKLCMILNFLLKKNSVKGEELYKKIKLRLLDTNFNVHKLRTNNLNLQNYFSKFRIPKQCFPRYLE